MRIRRYKGAVATGTLGTVIIVAHLVLAVALGLTASQWMGGAAIGAVLVVAAALHIVLATRRRASAAGRPRQPTR